LEKYEYNRNQRSQEIYEASPVKNVPKKSPMHRGEELASRKGAVAKWSVSISRLEAGMQQVSRLCRRMWDDKKAEQETPLLIANILHILAFVCLCLVAQAIALHLQYIGFGPC